MPAVEFEPTIPAGERPQTHALDRATTGTGCNTLLLTQFLFLKKVSKLMRLSYSLCVYQFQLLKQSYDFQESDFAKQDFIGMEVGK
jgi:hypothetical protein